MREDLARSDRAGVVVFRPLLWYTLSLLARDIRRRGRSFSQGFYGSNDMVPDPKHCPCRALGAVEIDNFVVLFHKASGTAKTEISNVLLK